MTSLDGHDEPRLLESNSDGFRTLRAGLTLGAAQPLTSRFAIFATGGGQLGVGCSRVYGNDCPDMTVLAATVGGRVGWRPGGPGPHLLVLDVAGSVLRLVADEYDRTVVMAGAMLSVAWDGPAR